MKHNWYVNLLNRIIIIIAPGYHLHKDPPTAKEKKAKEEQKKLIERAKEYA